MDNLDNTKYLGWFLTILRDDCNITIIRQKKTAKNHIIAENAKKADIDIKH